MSIKDLFYGKQKYKVVTSSSLDDIGNKVESVSYLEEYVNEKQRYIPTVDFGNPSEFSFYGSAEEYYEKTIQRIYNQYPYDGSLKERIEFINSSSYIDKWFFENEYPRTNGFVTLGQNWGNSSLGSRTTFTGDSNDYGNDTYIASPKPQYIFIKGGPHAAAIRPYDDKSLEVADFKNPLHKANLFDQNRDLESNLQIDGLSGSTVEFWFKAGGTASNNEKFLGPSPNIAFFDLWNSGSLEAGSQPSASYGRLLVEMRREASELDKLKGDNLFYFTVMSGAEGVDRAPLGAGTLTGSYPLDEWNHYAFTFQNNGSSTADKQLNLKLYINGKLQTTVVTGSSIGEVNVGPHLANIGSYIHAPNTGSAAGWGSGGSISYSNEGIGCVSGSFDEFRFWKERRNSERIFQNYNSHIGGGTNTDRSNNHLGFYYKFNEGVTETGSVDQKVLDYSGRVSNGLIKNYDSTLSMRATASAIVEAGAATAEFKDPIIYSYHPEVQRTEEEFVLKGKEHDFDNANMLYNTLPDWIVTEDENTQIVKSLFQVISAYFDQLHSLISDVPRLKDIRLLSGSTDKPLPFANELLESSGFFAPEIFPNATVLNSFLDRDKNGVMYDKPLHDIKNFIYENIYHNLTYINKSKGTTKAIRNLIRCFGVDDELFKINFYADNVSFKPETSYNITTVRKNFADFSSLERNNAVVFQSTASSNANSSGYLNHSANDTAGFDSDIGMTFESDIYFSSPPNTDDGNYTSGSFGYISSSMFGVHTAKASAADLGWASNDYGNFQVYAVRDEITTPNSKNAYFQLKSTTGGILAGNEITSSLFYDVYDNQKWNFAVVVKPAEYPNSTYVSGTTDDYTVEFHGYNMAADIVVDSFVVTASVTGQAGRRFVSSKKRFYVGAHRQDFAGSVIDPSNIRASGCKIWTIPLDESEIKAHARDITNFGVSNPHESAFLNENKSTFTGMVPKIKTLALHWDFETVSGSDASGEFLVDDLSSGSSDSRYGDWSAILEKQHTGQGMFFQSSNSGSISREYVATAKTQFLENLNNDSFIQVLDKDDEYFQKGYKSRPLRYFFTIEKSMYQSINDEMIDLFGNASGLQSYASVIGEPVNKYRQNYKKLKFIRGLFFDRISNTPDLEKYVEFYKWFDDAVSAMILNLIPATSDFAGVQNVVESHILERNKYQHKFPTVESKLPEISGSMEGINKLKYNWKFGHAPILTSPIAAAASTATITVIDSSAVPGVPYIGSGDTIRLISTDGTTVTLTMQGTGGSTTSTSTSGTSLTAKTLASGSYAESSLQATAQAVEIRTAINHHTLFTATNSANVITVTQNTAGAAGNTTVTKSELGATGMTNTNFTGGRDSDSAGATEGIQSKNTLWWKKIAEKGHRAPTGLNTGNDGVDNTRGFIHSASFEAFSRHQKSPVDFSVLEFRKEGPKNYRAFFPHLQYDSVNTIEIRESGVDSAIAFSGSDDHKELYPPKKFKAALFGNLGTKEGEEIHRHLFPFNIFSSSLDTKVSREFKEGLIITDQHRDTYHTFENEPLQGPFTNTHVGGNQYRHISLNKGAGEKMVARNRLGANDTDETRPEGWIIKFDKPRTEKRIRLVSPDFDGADKPRATYLRDETAKRPVNIRNIHYTTASQDLGNFTKNYEVVMTSGRDINNQYFKENLGVSVSGSQSSLISGTVDFTLPDRSSDAFRTKTVIAERFSAPGDVTTLSRGYMDLESESFSPHNNLNYRNFMVRDALRTLLTASSIHYGLADSLEAISTSGEDKDPFRRATFHKVNRNSAKRIQLKELNADGNPASSLMDDDNYQTGSVSDNFYVQHQIPRSVMQYSWITASATSGPFGFEKPNAAYASLASDDITFVSESDFGIINQSLTNTNSANTLGSNTVGITANRGSTKAKGILSFGGAATADQAVILVSTDGTTKTYVAKASNDFANNQFAVGASAATSAENLKDAINHSSGHAGKIVAVRSSNSVIMLQAEAGEDGNTIIQETLDAATAVGGDQITGNRFTGGASSVLKQPFVPLNILRSLNESEMRNNLVSFIPNPEFTNTNGEDIYNSLGIASSLNSNLLSINGPYGHPSWKQWRGGEHQITRYLNKNNIISVAIPKTLIDKDGKEIAAEDQLVSITEAPLTSKYKPLIHRLNLKKGGGAAVKNTYSNNIARLGNQPINVSGDQNVPMLDVLGVDASGPSPAIFQMRGEQTYDDLYKLYENGRSIPDVLNPLTYPTNENRYAKPVGSVDYSETVFPKEDYAYLDKVRSRGSYTVTNLDHRNLPLSHQRSFWRNAHIDRLRNDDETSLNSMGFKIDKDATKGFPFNLTSSVSGGIFAVDRSNPSPTTTVTASGGSAALSIWPLDTDGEGSAVYAFASSGSSAGYIQDAGTQDDRTTGPSYYIGRGAGELSNSTDWTLYYKDFPATASQCYSYVQLLHFSGAFQTNDTGGDFGAFNKSAKIPTYQTNKLIGTSPWYDSYEDYAIDIRYIAKDHTILPEFKISDHMEEYLNKGTVLTPLKNYLELEGASTTPSGSSIEDTFSKEFFGTYIETRPLNYYQKFRQEHLNADPSMEANVFTVSFEGIVKMLPYQGFYPALRTMQLGNMFSQSFGPYIGPADRNDWPTHADGKRNRATKTAALIQPWFNPGIMYNTIKSGVAVDWAVFKGDTVAQNPDGLSYMLEQGRRRGAGYISGTTAASDTYKGGPNFRFPFESLVAPERYIPVSGADDVGRISHLAPQWKNFYPKHGLAGHEDTGFLSTAEAGGGVNEPAVVTFTFTGAQTDGTKIGFDPFNRAGSTRITGTVDVNEATSTATVIGMNGVSNNTDRAQRFYNFLALAITGAAVPGYHVEQEDAVVTVRSHGATFNNDSDVTNGDGTIIDNVTISNSSKFKNGREANLAFFDWGGQNNPVYSYAMHNFLAEIPNFFLEKQRLNSNLNSYVSGPQSTWANFENGKKYYMDIVLSKEKEMVMFEGPARFMTPGEKTASTEHQIASARGIHYGPAMRWTANSGGSGQDYERQYQDPAFAAWTPPYFYGTSIARIQFDPSNVATNSTTDAYTIEEIFDKATVTYINLCERHPEFAQLADFAQQSSLQDGCGATPASASYMHLSSSVNMFGKAFPNLIKFHSDKTNVLGGLAPQEQEQGDDPVWVIAPKFECPILDFSGNVGPTKGTSDGNLTALQKACFDSKGMWYGSGSLPKENSGIVFSIRESFPDEIFKPTSTKKSLLQAVGFEAQEKKIGKIAGQKEISEAIVAIPFDAQTGEFFKINGHTYDTILKNIISGDPDIKVGDAPNLSADIAETSIGNMIRKMSDYVIPPFMDFRSFQVRENTPPFVMYIMEFKHILDQEDLQNIWQNVMPKIATTAKKSNTTISHQVGMPWEFFENGLPERDIKFKIFKVKKRARNNYYALTPAFEGQNALEANGIFDSVLDLSKAQDVPYSYNWPYDFFSLVETGKMDCKISFEPVAYDEEPIQQIGYKFPIREYKEQQIDSKPPKGDET